MQQHCLAQVHRLATMYYNKLQLQKCMNCNCFFIDFRFHLGLVTRFQKFLVMTLRLRIVLFKHHETSCVNEYKLY